jgi:UDP-glucose 4-epimerase
LSRGVRSKSRLCQLEVAWISGADTPQSCPSDRQTRRARRIATCRSVAAMRALVTGGAGFIGSHLVDALLARGDEVLVVDDLSTGSRTNLEAAIAAGSALSVLDVADGQAFAAAAEGFSPEAIFHLAAQADVRRSVADPALDARINVLGTINALEVARAHPGCALVFAATGGAVYGEGDDRELPFRESSPAEPLTPYGASKLAGEGYVSTYSRLHGVRGVALRFGNVYGPRQDPHGEAGVVAIFCGRLLDGIAPTVYGDGSQTRDYVYVADTAAACLAAADALAEGWRPTGPLNVGTGIETSVIDLLGTLTDASGVEVDHELAPARHGELHRVVIDPSAAGEALGWSAETSLHDGLAASFETLRAKRG